MKAGEKAVTAAMRESGTGLKIAWRGQITGVAFGRRLANSIRSQTYPKAGESLNAAALVWSKAPVIVVTCPHKTGPFIRRVCSFDVRSNEENRRCASHALPKNRSWGSCRSMRPGAKVSELYRRHGMSDATLYKWESRYGRMQVSELRRLKDLEAENAELKRLLADAMLERAIETPLVRAQWRAPA